MRRRAAALSAGGSLAVLREERKTTSSTPMVVRTDTSAAGHMRAKKVAPELGSPCRTIRFVRFEPGRKSEAAFDMNTAP
jgi:hypothetical protein